MTKLTRIVIPAAMAAAALFAALPATAQQRAQVVDDVHRFVLKHLDSVQPKSVAENRAYCGHVGLRTNGKIVASRARPGKGLACDPGPAPKGIESVATYRTQGAYDGRPKIELPFVPPLAGDLAAGRDAYVATPGGRVWLHLTIENTVYQVCGRGCVKGDAGAERCKGFVPRIDYTREALQKLEKSPPPKC